MTENELFWTVMLVHLRFATLAILIFASGWIVVTHVGSARYLYARLAIAFTLILINVTGIVVTLLILKVPYL